MKSISLLDCTLRDGGYINNWDFTAGQIKSVVTNLTLAAIEYIEIGYLTSITSNVNGTQFIDMEAASCFLPKDKGKSKYVIMADVAQFDKDTLCQRSANTLDGIRVVFYKRQIEQAYEFCAKVVSLGYDLFLQPMVTVDYTLEEFGRLVSRFQKNYPLYSVAIVDSFGCMTEKEVIKYANMLDNNIPQDIRLGFHSHNNMNLAMQNSLLLFDYPSDRELIIDASASGMGRGAGNLATEVIMNYCNAEQNGNYDIDAVMQVVSDVTEPLSRKHKWGYSPYMMLTAMRRAHPNFVTFLLANHDVSVSEFSDYLKIIPDEMLTKCTKPYVEELYKKFVASQPHKAGES